MTLSELQKFIAESPDKEWLQNYDLTGKNVITNNDYSIKGIAGIYELVSNQADGYSLLANLPDELARIKDQFIRTKANILQLISQGNVQKNVWDDNLRWLISGTPPAFNYDSPEANFLLKTYKDKPEYFQGAFNYFTGSLSNITQKEYLIGYLLAYEFTSKDFSSIAERKNSEEKSIFSIRNDFQKKLAEAQSEVVEYISKANQASEEYSKSINSLKDKKEKLFDDWFKKTSDDFSGFNTGSLKNVKDLESLYREKLKLEAPAKYWSDRAKKLRTEGNWWLAGLIICLMGGIALLSWSLSEISNGMLAKIFDNTGSSIKWSVVFITIVSFLAFAIKIFSKLTFSSFHLVRDAEEREQLTYVYLALQKEKGIDDAERHLIMQSLFSRAETGLLKDDSSPTMPGNIADKIISK